MRRAFVLPAALLFLGAALYAGLAWKNVVPGGAGLRRLVGVRSAAAEREEVRRRRIASFAAENATAPEDSIVFLGSSTIEFWPLSECFPGLPCLNRGVGSESAREVLARLDASLPARSPAAFVLYAGSADLRAHGLSPDDAARDVDALLAELRRRFPSAPIALLGVLPGRDLSPSELRDLGRLNSLLAESGARHGSRFVPTALPPLATPSGSLDPALSRDRWHLNAAGYRHLAAFILASSFPLLR